MSSHTLVETEEDVEAEEAMWKELNEEWSKLTLDDPNGVVDDVSSPSSQVVYLINIFSISNAGVQTIAYIRAMNLWRRTLLKIILILIKKV